MSSSDRLFWFLALHLLGAFQFGFLCAALCSEDIFCRLRLEGEGEGEVREVGLALCG